ncbi:MAG: hypothetical protein WKF31_07175 [Thermoleophilaceae bacterium]
MTVLATSSIASGDRYQANREHMLERLAEVERAQEEARAGGGERYVERHRARGKLPARERIELLVDRDAPFLELQPLIAYGTDYKVGGAW